LIKNQFLYFTLNFGENLRDSAAYCINILSLIWLYITSVKPFKRSTDNAQNILFVEKHTTHETVTKILCGFRTKPASFFALKMKFPRENLMLCTNRRLHRVPFTALTCGGSLSMINGNCWNKYRKSNQVSLPSPSPSSSRKWNK